MTTRKHSSDGHLAEMDFSRVEVGTVLRRVESDGGVSPFSDTVVTGVFIKFYGTSVPASAPNVQKALDTVEWAEGPNMENRIQIMLARPYLYASTIGICANHLIGVESFDCDPNGLRHYKIVEMSTGEPANRRR